MTTAQKDKEKEKKWDKGIVREENHKSVKRKRGNTKAGRQVSQNGFFRSPPRYIHRSRPWEKEELWWQARRLGGKTRTQRRAW